MPCAAACRQAKLDSLSLLGACAAGYGPGPLAPFTSTLWAALRSELAAPAAEGLLPADVPAADEVAAAAAACLERCVAAFQQGQGEAASLADAVLADHSMQDMLACIRSPGQDAAKHRRSTQRAKAGARAAAALCRAGGAAAAKALRQLLPPLLDEVAMHEGGAAPGGSTGASWQPQCLGWAAVVELLQAAAAAPPADTSIDAALLQRVVSAAAAALANIATEQAAAAHDAMDVDASEVAGLAAPGANQWPVAPADCTWQHAATLQLAVLGAVFGSPALAAAVQPAQAEAAVGSVLQLLAVPNLSQQQQAAAVRPLAALACSSHSALLAACALPQLMAAAEEPESAAAALEALQALAAASSSLQAEIVADLDGAIQRQLRAAAAEAEGSGGTAQLLQQLLKAAATIITGAASLSASASSASDATGQAGEAGESSGAFLKLGEHLFEAASHLPQSAAAAASPTLQSACAELAYHAVRSAAAAQQAPLAAAAAAALQTGPQPCLQACIACALLVPLRPEAVGALPGGPAAPLVGRLVQLAAGQQQEGPAAQWAALAAAALLNKWPGGELASRVLQSGFCLCCSWLSMLAASCIMWPAHLSCPKSSSLPPFHLQTRPALCSAVQQCCRGSSTRRAAWQALNQAAPLDTARSPPLHRLPGRAWQQWLEA